MLRRLWCLLTRQGSSQSHKSVEDSSLTPQNSVLKQQRTAPATSPTQKCSASLPTPNITIEVTLTYPKKADPSSIQPKSAPLTKTPAPPAIWVPPGQTITVGDYIIPGGMLYVGSQLAAIRPYSDVEPCLINPQLNIDRSAPDYAGSSMNYWPSYSAIPASCRAAYLEWLAGGRSNPRAYLGYVFLFFYGLERRVLRDLRASKADMSKELGLIITEVDRLLGIYGSNKSFDGYANQFLEICRILQPRTYLYETYTPLSRTSWELPLSLQIALGRLVAEQKPIPADLALSWYVHSPRARLRTPATRCAEEFQYFFRLKYVQQFGEGLVLEPNNNRLKGSYHPASASFSGAVEIDVGELPDVTSLSAPLDRLQILVDDCTDALEPFSRWLGRHPESRGSYAAVALLPHELAVICENDDTKTFRQWLEHCLSSSDQAVITGKELLQHWKPEAPGKLVKIDTTLLLQFLEKHGYGIEPDIRCIGRALTAEENLVLLRLPMGRQETASPEYTVATLLLYLATTVASADGVINTSAQAYLESHLESAWDLSEPEWLRLRAHLKWLLQEKRSLRGLKPRLAAIALEKRTEIAQFLIHVAWADGAVSPQEISTLTKIYPLLGLDPQDVYSHIHQLRASPTISAPATEPVTVRPSAVTQKGFAIPSPPAVTKDEVPQEEPGFVLDMQLIAAKKTESAEVAAILGDIFVENEQPVPSTVPTPEVSEGAIVGLDAAHSALIQRLREQGLWSRNDLEQVMTELGLMMDGALEIINEAALDKCEELLTEGDDPIEVNSKVLEGLLS